MTPPKTKKLFISYRSSDAAKVDKIARDLTLLKYDDGTPRYMTWQDKQNLPPASPSWWDAIVDAIIDCDMFVFNLSRASLESEVCRAELDYARKRNRPIVPVVLDGEFFLNAQSGKYDLPKDTWVLVPDWLGQAQFLFYISTQFYTQFQAAVELFERHWPRDINAPRPLNPDNRSVHASNHALYAAARDYAYRLAFADAEKHFDILVRRNDPVYADAAAHWLERIRLYAELIEIEEQRSPSFAFKRTWAAYEGLPNEYLDGESFDPKGFAVRRQESPPAVIAQRSADPTDLPDWLLSTLEPRSADPTEEVSDWVFPEPAPRNADATDLPDWLLSTLEPRNLDLLPAPFAWIEIPKKGYFIAKYPLTNAQYELFVDAGGYAEKRWWTQAGWQQCEPGEWTEPHYWKYAKWNGAEQPVVGVSWFEAMAYCRWLSELTGESIMLPTEDQWQYAAQGDDGRDYPWGMEWNASYCNNTAGWTGIGQTTPVTKYEAKNKGASPFGVVDMAGNVWEWCLTAYESGTNDLEGRVARVMRGGSWAGNAPDYFRCAYRSSGEPYERTAYTGFRLALV